MADIRYKTKGNSRPDRKPRVYFTCHPDDFERYFKKICDDIFKTHDCAIFYTENFSECIPNQDLATDIGSNNLFVVPVTLKLLSSPNRAMDADIPYAIHENIPLLPIVMESGLDQLYSRVDKFGDIQYISPYSVDRTEVPYDEKLRKYLDSVLISNEMGKRIREAFDAYIFLSYRKKDRRYANELMRIIHRNPYCRDIAIWYDEFLVPGESFVENIQRILSDSKLFTMLVTPSILEEPDGKPNYVMGQEYPAAKASGIEILPIEMQETDKGALHQKFKDLPECVNIYDTDFQERLLGAVMRTALQTNNTEQRNAEHNFLVGLAYMDGIDVEVDRERALEMITAAAQEELPEAMKKLLWMYMRGQGVKLDYQKAAKWAEKTADYYLKEQSEGSDDAITALLDLVTAYNNVGNHQQALIISKKALELSVNIYGKTSPMVFVPFKYLSETYFLMGDYRKSAEYTSMLYEEYSAFWGKEDSRTISMLSKLAQAYDRIGELNKAIEFQKQAYFAFNKTLGEEHFDTLNSLSELAITYDKAGDHRHSIELMEKVYSTRCRVWGETHHNTLVSLNNLTVPYCKLGNKEKAIPLLERSYILHREALGEENPDTIRTLGNMANFYGQIGDHQKAAALKRIVYDQFTKILGSKHPDTLKTVVNLAIEYSELEEHEVAFNLLKMVHPEFTQIFGAEHPDTQYVQTMISVVSRRIRVAQEQKNCENRRILLQCQELRQQMEMYKNLDNITKALAISQELYDRLCKCSGKKNLDTIHVLQEQIDLYCDLEKYQEALNVAEVVYASYAELKGKNCSEAIECAKTVGYLYKKLGNNKKAVDFKKRAFADAKRKSIISQLFKGKRL